MNNKLVKYACYTSNISMAVVGNLSPLLFLTFNTMYRISYSLLGLLVLINFVTQLSIDLVFSFFSHKFNIEKTLRIMPLLTILGLVIYSLSPYIFSDSEYTGLVIGTVLFSAASGLAEVLISPTIAALPADDPDREMSKLHSIYAWGVVGVVTVSTVFLLLFGQQNWQWLPLIFTVIPISSFILFSICKIPEMKTPKKTSGAISYLKNKAIWACFIGIFLGGAAECVMAQWSSAYLEQAFNIPKIWGDIFGVALFAVMLGIGRSLYAKIGKNISKVLFLGAIGAAVCYLVSAVSPIPIIGLFACAFTGFCVSMLWPGSLIVASDKFPSGGVFIFALMAAGGDLGASVGPQLVGIITDATIINPQAIELANRLSMTPDQFGMKLGMLIGMLFPFAAIFVYMTFMKKKRKFGK